MRPVTAIVLAGGASSRMGRDKASMTLGRRTMVERVVGAAFGAGAAAIVIGGGPFPALDPEVRHLPDRWPGEGPLGGIVTGLHHTTTELAVVLACDLPSITPAELIEAIAALGRAQVAVPLVDGEPQWLCCALRVDAAEPALVAAFDAGVRSAGKALARLVVNRFDAAQPDALRDVDTPDDLDRLAGFADGAEPGR